MKAGREFFNLYNHDLVRLAVAIPAVRVADPAFNGDQTLALIRKRRRSQSRAGAVSRNWDFPPTPATISSSSGWCSTDASRRCTNPRSDAPICRSSASIGLPLEVGNLLFNCAAVISRGRILGVVPKTYLPSYREFYEVRQFTSGDCGAAGSDRSRRAARDSVRQPPSLFRVRGDSRLRFSRRNLRGPVGADPAVLVCGAGRRDRTAQSLGLQYHRRQSRFSPHAGRRANRRDASRHISIRRRGRANRPPTSPGTGRR